MRVIGRSISNKIRQNNLTMVKAVRENRKSHPKCVLLENFNINSIGNEFSNILFLIENNLGALIIAEAKLNSSFPESQFLLEGMRKPFRWLISFCK